MGQAIPRDPHYGRHRPARLMISRVPAEPVKALLQPGSIPLLLTSSFQSHWDFVKGSRTAVRVTLSPTSVTLSPTFNPSHQCYASTVTTYIATQIGAMRCLIAYGGGVGVSSREQNEKKFPQWEILPNGGRRYWIDVIGRQGWKARYVKEVDSAEATVRFYQEVYDHTGKLVEVHYKYPDDQGHRKV
jgi:hypothetical protein